MYWSRCFNADMWRRGLSKSPACNCGADRQTANYIITEYSPLSSTNWSPWFDWCWCRCSNSWLASQQVPRDLSISFDYMVSHARRRRRYHMISYDMLSYHIKSNHISYHHPILSYPILSYPILSYPILSYPILSYPILSYPILSYHTLGRHEYFHPIGRNPSNIEPY